MNVTPGTEDETCLLLPLQRRDQPCTVNQCLLSTLKIGLFLWRYRRISFQSPGASVVEGLQTICFEWLGLASAQAFNGILQFEDALFECLYNADAVGTGISRNDTCLPEVEQTAYDAADDE